MALINCPRCAGTGNYRNYGVCFRCRGTGTSHAAPAHPVTLRPRTAADLRHAIARFDDLIAAGAGGYNMPDVLAARARLVGELAALA